MTQRVNYCKNHSGFNYEGTEVWTYDPALDINWIADSVELVDSQCGKCLVEKQDRFDKDMESIKRNPWSTY